MQKHFIDGVAVSDAIRLKAAFGALSEIYRQGELTDADRSSPTFRRYQLQMDNGAGVGLDAEWVRHCTLQDLAAQSLGQALRGGHLTGWVVAATFAEIALEPAAFEWAVLPENESQVIKTGIFHTTSQYAGWGFCGATLWLKQLDWEVFRAKADFDRRGIALPQSPDAFSDDEIKGWIGDCGYTSRNPARKAFMLLERAHGLSGAFDAHWREIHKRGPGRPPKSRAQ